MLKPESVRALADLRAHLAEEAAEIQRLVEGIEIVLQRWGRPLAEPSPNGKAERGKPEKSSPGARTKRKTPREKRAPGAGDGRRHRTSPARIAEITPKILAMRAEDRTLSSDEIAAQFGISGVTVRRILARTTSGKPSNPSLTHAALKPAGKSGGPCVNVEKCDHSTCLKIRRIASSKCVSCPDRIGYGVAFVSARDGYRHASCKAVV